MQQRDYILRMIEQLGSALARVRKMIIGRGAPRAIDDALAQASDQAGFDITLLRSFTVGTLHMFVAPVGDVDPTRCWLMAEVLYLDGLQASLEGRDADALDSLIKARSLYDLIRPMGGMLVGMPEASARISEIDELIEAVPEDSASSDDLPGDDFGDARGRRLRAGGRRRPGVAA